MEDKLKQSEKFLNSLVENIPDMIFVKDAKELRRSWNKIKNIIFSRIPKDGNGLDFNDLREMSMILQRGSYVVDKIVRIERDAWGLNNGKKNGDTHIEKMQVNIDPTPVREALKRIQWLATTR